MDQAVVAKPITYKMAANTKQRKMAPASPLKLMVWTATPAGAVWVVVTVVLVTGIVAGGF